MRIIPRNNCCDGIYKSFDVHFTSFCNNSCPYCIDKRTTYRSKNKFPDWKAMAETVLENKDRINDILILGGEPLLFPKELLAFVENVKSNSSLKIFITTSLPQCTTGREQKRFEKILSIIDGLNISAHHYDDKKASKIRNTIFDYPRSEIYSKLPYKNKIRICLNLVKGILDTREEIEQAIRYFGEFGSIKLSELQHAPDCYVSFENIMGIKLPSPYFNGCQTSVKRLFPDANCDIVLKRSCFLVEPSLKASIMDGIKVFHKRFFPACDSIFGVVFEDGTLRNGW